MGPKHRVSRVRAREYDGELDSRAFIKLILDEVVLRKADDRTRRAVIVFAAAAMSTLLRRTPEKSLIRLSDLRSLGATQRDRLLCATRYVLFSHARRGRKAGLTNAAGPFGGKDGIVRSRGKRELRSARSRSVGWH
jgi:hypothetical protein